MFEDHSHRVGQGRPEAESRYTDADRAQTARAREAAEALFAPKRETKPVAAEPEQPTERGPRKPRFLRALPEQPAQGEPPAKPAKRKPRPAPAWAKLSEPPKIPPSHIPRIRTWLKYGMTVPQVADLYGVPAADLTCLLQTA